MPERPLVWLLSAYRSESHASWVNWLSNQQDCPVRLRIFELPGRYFRWRIRGNPLSWMAEFRDALQQEQPHHILATSMVDIATIKGLHPELADIPVTLYFHENQFAYPVGDRQHSSIDPQMVQLYGALTSERCLFNSRFNLESMLEGVTELLRKLPDATPDHVVDELRAKSSVLPVAVETVNTDTIPAQTGTMPMILWNHRWEYDKRPDRFEAVLDMLANRGVDFQLALLGPRPEKVPGELSAIREKHAARIVADGMVPRAEYETLLKRARVVISTADHEFQGLSMIEAVSAGATPVVPDALCYREQYPGRFRYTPGNIEEAADRVSDALQHSSPVDISRWTASHTGELWRNLMIYFSLPVGAIEDTNGTAAWDFYTG
ncbi:MULTISPECIES: tRNA-queuosine alpha-mannosyltransferase domain-containing protein [Thalassolituus]|jgi:glycosyltransferase involved in cell wall biosynthesis|uniref:tRNA-queuosine alpha-mannosyltransferase domain-containing protein n=1 Tax=Thalassolituus TaxID=187492 RepID=UPI000C550D8C|nr:MULTISPECIES: DUF3524 domain-containing protein [Thalassolituus]MAX87174.1 glycosyl transferase family 1 [Oceanospirillaceae bacterium]MDQ4427441.1 DUF3524 domain-containing protein [Thalassolituus sp.]MEC8908858.1 DUF3524 domain-containing protein [Pseudomonadota bacterium]HCG79376.1 DUF3524 domain-containing protein [Oceanospirillales bacterium]|tara:strand:+ start:31529 stop:32662 length:1134 start_codon:yes stop_codon:yes gene_type:complete